MNQMRMYAFHCGGEQTLRSVLDPFDDDCAAIIHAPYFFYLIRHPDGDVLFDNGAHPAFISDPRSRLGDAADLYNVVMVPGDDVVSKLRTLGVEADNIGHVVQSHLHYDHAGGLEFLTSAMVYVQKEELPFASWPPVYQRDVYVRQDFDGVRNWKELRGDYDIFNDGRLMIISTPGHTPGHQSLLVKLENQAYILTGDAMYDRQKATERRLPGLLWSPDALVESWERIEELQRRYKAELIVTHDLHWEESVKVAPEQWYE
jgi:N-acyl homoserine lactone hydrolase